MYTLREREWGGNLMTRVGVDLKTEGGALHR
jgi:hypothetical protein